MMVNGLLTVAEAAERLKLSDTQIRRICAAGQFPGVQRAGRAWLIPERSVMTYKPGPQGFAAVWKKINEQKEALRAQKAAMEQVEAKA